MRLLSLICLARCAAALPDIGVTYAATGRLNVLMAAESVRRLSTRYAHIHTLSADDHAMVELSVVATSLWQCPGVLLDGARVDGVGPRAAADLHRPRVPQTAGVRRAVRERVVLPRRRRRRGTTTSMM